MTKNTRKLKTPGQMTQDRDATLKDLQKAQRTVAQGHFKKNISMEAK